MADKKHLLLVPSTHWDREWYKTQAEFNVYLTELFDQVLRRLESGELASFFTDGQAVIVEDILTLKPQWKERIARFAAEGKLEIGPFYALTDMYIPSGESFFRNISCGLEIVRTLGGKTGIPYAPDAFGHNADLPAILASAGFDAYFFCRGMGDQLTPPRSEFIWHDRYNNYKLLGLAAIIDIFHPVTGAWICGAYALGMDLPRNDGEFKERLEILMHDLEKYSDLPDQLAINGSDHLLPEDDLAGRIERFNNSGADFTAESAPIADFVARAWRNLDLKKLPAVSGELTAGKFFRILTGTTSSRVNLKIRNARAQYYLEKIVEPAMAEAPDEVRRLYQEHLDNAWKMLLQNQTHDSICGCGTDAVVRENEVRFDRIEKSMTVIAERLLRLKYGVEDLRMLMPKPGAELIKIAIRSNMYGCTDRLWSFSVVLPDKIDINDYVLEDGQGREWDFIAEDEEKAGTTNGPFLPSGPMGYLCSRLRIFTDMPMPEGFSTASAFFRKKAKTHREGEGVLPLTVSGGELVLTGPEGSVQGFLTLCDTTDCGDEYDYRSGADAVTAFNTPWRTGKEVRCGTLFRQEFFCEISVPEKRGSAVEVRLPIRLLITGRAGEKAFQAQLFVENKAADHRLQLIVRMPFEFTEYCRQSQIQHIMTPVAPFPEGADWRDRTEPLRRNFGFLSVRSAAGVFSVMPRGLHEHTSDGRSFAITLLRAVGNLGNTGAGPQIRTPEAQLPGEHHFTIAFSREGEGMAGNALWKQSDRLLNDACGVVLHPGVETVNMTGSSLKLISQELLISGFLYDGYLKKRILRIFNPACVKGSGRLCGDGVPERLAEVTYSYGTPAESGRYVDPSSIVLQPGEILTLAY